MARHSSHGRPPGDDWMRQMWGMGKATEIWLSKDNGHICEAIPVCHKPAVVTLKFTHETVNLCREAYERYRGKK